MTRQIVLDTETTGLDPSDGHRIIEIGCVELVDRKLTGNRYHQYINPEREIDAGAIEVHGITNEKLADKPRFADIVEDFLGFVSGAELVIHNAPFDVGFIDAELKRLRAGHGELTKYCTVLDTLAMARRMHPGQKNNLDALCKRYAVDNSSRDLHGALLDAEILADVYLLMTGGQTALSLDAETEASGERKPEQIQRVAQDRRRLKVICASIEEESANEACLGNIEKVASGGCLWKRLPGEVVS